MSAVEIQADRPVAWRQPAFLKAVRGFAAGQLALQKERLFLWFPVILSIGIGIYFSLPAEPPLALGLMLLSFSLAALLLAPEGQRILFFIVVLIAAGFSSGQIATRNSHTAILQKEIKVTNVEGRIVSIEDMEDGQGSRIILSEVTIERLLPEETPRRVRLTVRKDEGLSVGARVRMLAGIDAPASPLRPGGFDFQRYMYFQQIGAMGFAFKPAEILASPDGARDWIERLRVAIDQRITAALPYPEAGIALALVTGRRAGISEGVNEAITAAGLAHLLSISGLHIGLAAGIVFFAMRFLMVCIPGFAIRHPVKKYAAAFAFASALFYVMLAGAPIPAQRSLIMVGIALLAVVLDRSPISVRLVACAAFVVLLLSPDSLLSASFQMSFAAVTALVVIFDITRGKFSAFYREAGFIKKAALYFMMLGLTSVVATVATAPFTVFHFQQLTIYSVISNAVSVPLSGIVIMPAAVLSLLLMPFGLDYWPLQAVGAGCEAIIGISQWVAGLPHAMVRVPSTPDAVLPLFMIGLILAFLVKGWARVAAAVPFAVIIVMIIFYRQPDILIAPGFDIVAYKPAQGPPMVSTLRRGEYIREKWEISYGFDEGSSVAWPKEGRAGDVVCDEMACRIDIRGRHVSVLRNPAALGEECGWADLVLSEQPVGKRGCRGIPVIDKFHAIRNGSYAIWMEEDGMRIEAAEKLRGVRPWSGGNSLYAFPAQEGILGAAEKGPRLRGEDNNQISQ